MSRKKKKRRQAPPRQVIPFTPRPVVPATPPRFAPGTPVRVRAGVHDPDFPGLDLGGWTGTILEVEGDQDGVNYQLLWTEETLRRIDPRWRERCEEEGLDFDTIWLLETDLDPDPTRPVQDPASLQVARLPPRPPELEEQEKRIRAALGVPVGADIPLVSEASLEVYQRYLTARLVFPLPCVEFPSDEKAEPAEVTLVGLTASGDPRIGIVADIRRGATEDFVPLWTLTTLEPSEARQLLEDHAFWCWSRHPLQGGVGGESSPFSGGTNPIWNTIKASASYGAGCGATTGALLATDANAPMGMWMGMGILGIAGYLAGSRFGRVFGTLQGMRFGHLHGGIFGMLAGVLVGAAIGVMLVGALGTVPGAIVGSLLGSACSARKWEPIGRNSWAPLGACIGGIVLASWSDREKAFYGALVGAGSGAALSALVVMMMLLSLGFASRGTK